MSRGGQPEQQQLLQARPILAASLQDIGPLAIRVGLVVLKAVAADDAGDPSAP